MKYNKEKQNLLKSFDQELATYTGQVHLLAPVVYSVLLVIMGSFPLQMLLDDSKMILFWSVWAIFQSVFYYLQGYMQVTDTKDNQKRHHSLAQIMRMMPISKRDLICVRMRYVMKFCGILTIILMIFQCTFAALAGCLSLWNVIYILGLGFILPVIWARLLLCVAWK